MRSTRGWWIILSCLLVIYLVNTCLVQSMSTNNLRHHRNALIQPEERYMNLSTLTTNEDESGSCCSREEKYVSIGFGMSGEMVEVDVGRCRKFCRRQDHSWISPAEENHRIRGTRQLPSMLRRRSCSEAMTCEATKSKVQRVSTLNGVKEVSIVEDCHCRAEPEACQRVPHLVSLFHGTPFETHVDLGTCQGGCSSVNSEHACRPLRNRTISIPGPNGDTCISTVESCRCSPSCYRMNSFETIYDYSQGYEDDNITNSEPVIKEIDVGSCVGSCTSGKTHRCLLRDKENPSKCLTGLYSRRSTCNPSKFQVHKYMTKDGEEREIIAITDCICM